MQFHAVRTVDLSEIGIELSPDQVGFVIILVARESLVETLGNLVLPAEGREGSRFHPVVPFRRVRNLTCGAGRIGERGRRGLVSRKDPGRFGRISLPERLTTVHEVTSVQRL